jgi:hypothetical protein
MLLTFSSAKNFMPLSPPAEAIRQCSMRWLHTRLQLEYLRALIWDNQTEFLRMKCLG